jgi:hypothetical protein
MTALWNAFPLRMLVLFMPYNHALDTREIKARVKRRPT